MLRSKESLAFNLTFPSPSLFFRSPRVLCARQQAHGELDFGSFTQQGRKLFWKIDTYDAACEFGSEDPADPTKTTRVLTIMLAEED